MKIYGLFWGIFNCVNLLIGICLSYLLSKFDNLWTNPIYGYILCLIAFLIFFNLIIVKDGKVIIIRPSWFLYKRNIFNASEINQVKFVKMYYTASSSSHLKFIDKEGFILLDTTIYWFKFEEKRLLNKLMELGIEINADFD